MTKGLLVFFMICFVMCFSAQTLMGEKLASLPDIKQPKGLAVDDTQLYITENATIFIYSLKDFKLVKKFGSKGQGPQEFQTLPHVPVSVDVSTDKLIAASIRKLSYFTKKGEFINEVRAASLALNLRLCNDRFLGWSQARDKGVIFNTVNLYDAKLNKVQEVFRMQDSYQGAGKGYKILHNVFTYHALEGKIVLPGEDDATINIFDEKMNKLASIRLEQKRKKVDNSFKTKMIHHLKTSPESKTIFPQLKPIIFPDYFPVISDFFVDNIDGGIIYVMTWKREKGANEFFLYDLKGNFKKKKMLPIRYETDLATYPITVKKGVLYQLVEHEEDEVWEFHATKIE